MTIAGSVGRHVGMGEIAVAKGPQSLEIRGLGSCIALAVHDPLQRLAGLAHVVIPRPLPTAPPAPGWAATSAVPALLDAMETQGGRTNRLVARIAGGATMFHGLKKGYDVGRENAEIVEALLRAYKVPLLSRQVGGRASRSVVLRADDGRLDVTAASASGRLGARRAGADPREDVRILIEAVAAPLSDLLQRPVVVDSAGRYDLTADEALEFLGPRTRLRWSILRYWAGSTAGALRLAIPDAHAARIDEELRARLDEPGREGEAMDEVLNIMVSHGLTALARIRAATMRPSSVQVQRGVAQDLVEPLGQSVRVAHARLHLEGAFRGADLALLGQDLP